MNGREEAAGDDDDGPDVEVHRVHQDFAHLIIRRTKRSINFKLGCLIIV